MKEYPEEQRSDYFTAMNPLAKACHDIIDNYIVKNVLRPLQQTIAIS